MKYIRTEDGIYEPDGETDDGRLLLVKVKGGWNYLPKQPILKQAGTIEQLCDEFVGIRKSDHKAYTGKLDGYWFEETNGWLGRLDKYEIIYGAIWTDKGLIYVAKMNNKGKFELL